MTANINECDILLIEDNPNDAELTLHALKKNNLANNIFVVKDGEEAIDFIFATGQYTNRNINFPPKVVFLDLKLPKVSGIEVLRKFKSNEKTKTIPVVVVTSSQETQDIQECYTLGVNSYIQKPIEFDNFVKAISEVGLYWLVINKSLR
ncbi:MAG TPA: response regulator [Candidatus Sulfotelmatobacter sp.]|jgi:two-component system response regulator|nr:response regulator [Candidatus Sulfotelmatobacter sp.]